MYSDYNEFFTHVTMGCPPYPYQEELAEREHWPTLLKVATGTGKTEAILLAWLWRRRFHPNPEVRKSTPRRLIICLPMRVLVDQSQQRMQTYLERLGLSGESSTGINLQVLMGGEKRSDWDRFPDRDAVILGTQDMLLSAALNRGYGLSRFRWPIPFGLLNNDVLWVIDEPQLMGSGLATTSQLHGLREKLGTYGRTETLWMSATIEPSWLETVDMPRPISTMELSAADRECSALRERLQAVKRMRFSGVRDAGSNPGRAAKAILSAHQPGHLTLVVVNRVGTAVAIHRELQRLTAREDLELLLLHSRFRPYERLPKMKQLQAETHRNRIVVATQVVEAGVDISARVLFTEVAPWPSLVQRLGRCNRTGRYAEADVYWMDVSGRTEKEAAPYRPEELAQSRARLQGLEGASVGPDRLPAVALEIETGTVLRRKDLVELFDTSPDISGNDIDVSQYVRGADRSPDVFVFWRQVEGAPPAADIPGPHQKELCAVPVYRFREFLNQADRKKRVFYWDAIEGKWLAVGRDSVLRPGQTFLAAADVGGYDVETGWSPEAKYTEPCPIPDQEVPLSQDSVSRDDRARQTQPMAIAEHTDRIVAESQTILGALADVITDSEVVQAVTDACRWHDCGKAHDVFQRAVGSGAPAGVLLAKSGGRKPLRYDRPYFRHELASGLALLAHHADDRLAAYLAASHHGKVRLAIRSLPEEALTANGKRLAMGIRDGDKLPETPLGGGVVCPKTEITLSLMEMGQGAEPSWTERVLDLRDDPQLGPFRLAFLEAVVRAADARGSREGGEGA